MKMGDREEITIIIHCIVHALPVYGAAGSPIHHLVIFHSNHRPTTPATMYPIILHWLTPWPLSPNARAALRDVDCSVLPNELNEPP